MIKNDIIDVLEKKDNLSTIEIASELVESVNHIGTCLSKLYKNNIVDRKEAGAGRTKYFIYWIVKKGVWWYTLFNAKRIRDSI